MKWKVEALFLKFNAGSAAAALQEPTLGVLIEVQGHRPMIESELREQPSARSRFLVHVFCRGAGTILIPSHATKLRSWIVGGLSPFLCCGTSQFLRLTTLRMVELEEIERGAFA